MTQNFSTLWLQTEWMSTRSILTNLKFPLIGSQSTQITHNIVFTSTQQISSSLILLHIQTQAQLIFTWRLKTTILAIITHIAITIPIIWTLEPLLLTILCPQFEEITKISRSSTLMFNSLLQAQDMLIWIYLVFRIMAMLLSIIGH